jgi:hypothetical protein
VERVVLNALRINAALPPDVCASGDQSAIVFRPGESSIREADPPRRNCGKGFTNRIENQHTFRQ